jgi:hypothetical protein
MMFTAPVDQGQSKTIEYGWQDGWLVRSDAMGLTKVWPWNESRARCAEIDAWDPWACPPPRWAQELLDNEGQEVDETDGDV